MPTEPGSASADPTRRSWGAARRALRSSQTAGMRGSVRTARLPTPTQAYFSRIATCAPNGLATRKPRTFVRAYLGNQFRSAERISDAGHSRPQDVRLACLHLGGHRPARCRDDLDAPLDNELLSPVKFAAVDRRPGHIVAGNCNRLKNVAQPQFERMVRHQKICRAEASTRSRTSGCGLCLVMMSVLRPRMRAVCSFTSIRSNTLSLPCS